MHRTGVCVCVLVGLVGLVGLFAAGCDHVGSSARNYAKSACDAYQHIGRVQVATTTAQLAAIRDVARSDVRAAAAFDPRWAQLSSDMLDALDLWATSSDRFFEVDKRVQDQCSGAGRDIGDLKP